MPIVSGVGAFNGGTVRGSVNVANPSNAATDLLLVTEPAGFAASSGTGNAIRLTDGTTDVMLMDAYGELIVKAPVGQGSAALKLRSADHPSFVADITTATLHVTDNAGVDVINASASGFTVAGTQMGFYGHTAASQAAAIGDAAGGAIIDAQARTALNSLLAAMRAVGLIAT